MDTPPALTRHGRLRIEPLQPAHADTLFAAFDDPRVHRYVDGERPASREAMRDDFARLARGAPPGRGQQWLNWAFQPAAGGPFIGTLQATVIERNHSAWIGYTLAPAAWGQGLATEAVLWLLDQLREAPWSVQCVRAGVDERNLASVRLLQRLGFDPLGPRATELHGVPSVDLHFQRALAPGAAGVIVLPDPGP